VPLILTSSLLDVKRFDSAVDWLRHGRISLFSQPRQPTFPLNKRDRAALLVTAIPGLFLISCYFISASCAFLLLPTPYHEFSTTQPVPCCSGPWRPQLQRLDVGEL
jgi:hypothetical protein